MNFLLSTRRNGVRETNEEEGDLIDFRRQRKDVEIRIIGFGDENVRWLMIVEKWSESWRRLGRHVGSFFRVWIDNSTKTAIISTAARADSAGWFLSR